MCPDKPICTIRATFIAMIRARGLQLPCCRGYVWGEPLPDPDPWARCWK